MLRGSGHFSQVTWHPQSPSVVCFFFFLFCVSESIATFVMSPTIHERSGFQNFVCSARQLNVIVKLLRKRLKLPPLKLAPRKYWKDNYFTVENTFIILTLLVMEIEKLKSNNRIRKMVSFESVNVDSEFFICLTHATKRNHLSLESNCFLKEVDRIMHAKFFRASLLLLSIENCRRSPQRNLSVIYLNGSTNFKRRYSLTNRRVC